MGMELCNFTIFGWNGCKAILTGIGLWVGVPILIGIVGLIVVVVIRHLGSK